MILALGAALATSWAPVAPSEEAALARTPDGAVHVAYVRDGGLFHVNPGTGATTPIGPGVVRPALVSGADGLRVYTDSLAAVSGDGGASWVAGANGAAGEVSAAVQLDGSVLQAWNVGNDLKVGAADYGDGAFPSVAPGAVAWVVRDGVRVRTVGPDGAPVGEVQTVPGGESQGRPSLVATSDGGYVVAVGPVVWRVGSRTTLSLNGSASSLSADARGRVWATWTDDERLYAARSNRDVSELGAPVDLGPTATNRPQISATNTAAHVLAGARGTSYLRRVLPGLTLDERHRREIFTFSVTDAGDPVRGAVVKVGKRSGKTDRNGRVTLRVSDRRLRVTATLKGYSNARLTLK